MGSMKKYFNESSFIALVKIKEIFKKKSTHTHTCGITDPLQNVLLIFTLIGLAVLEKIFLNILSFSLAGPTMPLNLNLEIFFQITPIFIVHLYFTLRLFADLFFGNDKLTA